MAKNRIKVYWLLLLVLLYTAGAVLSVGEAQARYVTTATWNTVVQHEETGVTSDCLEDVSGAPLTILLGTMPQEPCPISFTLSAGEAASGNLAWTVDLPEYISVEMRIGDTVITPDNTIEIVAGDTVTVTMTLTPTETAFTEVRDAVNVSVTVTWADTLKGTFLTQLPAVVEEEPTEETEPPTEETEPPTEETEPPTEETEPPATEETEPSTEETEPDPTEATEPDPTEETEPGPTEGTSGFRIPVFSHKLSGKPGSRLTTNTETTEGGTEPEEETTGPTEETEPEPSEDPTEPSGEPEGQSEETTDPSDGNTEGGAGDAEDGSGSTEDTSDDTTDPDQPGQEEPTVTPIVLEAVSTVNTADALPIQITAPENGGPVRLGLATVMEPADLEGESQTVLEDFPRYTRFSLTDGDSYFMLYNADTIALKPEAGETMISVLLDLSHVGLEDSQVTLGASHGEESYISTCTATVIPESAQCAVFHSRILSANMPLEISIGEYWEDYTLEYTVEMLTTIPYEDGETETIGYVPVELAEDSLWAELTSDETGTKLVFSIGETLPPAGTYRVNLSWTQEGICRAQLQETIFINYSVYTESEETGGAEQ